MKRAARRPTREAPPPPPRERYQCDCVEAGLRLLRTMGGMARSPVFDHFRNAGVEVLLGFRAILDAQIEAMTPKNKKGTRVTVE